MKTVARMMLGAALLCGTTAWGQDGDSRSAVLNVEGMSLGLTYKVFLARFPRAEFRGELGNLRFWLEPRSDVLVGFDVGTPAWDLVAILKRVTDGPLTPLAPLHAEWRRQWGTPVTDRSPLLTAMLRSESVETLVARIIRPIGIDGLLRSRSVGTHRTFKSQGTLVSFWAVKECDLGFGVVEHAMEDAATHEVVGEAIALVHRLSISSKNSLRLP
jgi:hypothetical protein